MKKIFPSNKSTEFSPDLREWVPTSMDNLLRELDHISKACEQEDHLVLFRGQSNSEWPLDSTFVRDSIKHLFGINTYSDLPVSIRHQVSFHRVIASLLLMKFGTIWKPSKESFEKEKSSDIDPWYELLKNIQQYPENYYSTDFVKGTFFIDWTMYKEIALYFAVFEGRGAKREVSATTGAIWAYDSSSTGNVLQNNKLERILELMAEPTFLNGEKTFPLIFHPQKQTNQLRAQNQKPTYIAQMDFRYDLADVWADYEMRGNEKVFVKLCISQHVKHELAKYLESKSVTEGFVYPH